MVERQQREPVATLARAWANITTLLLAVLAAAMFTAPATLEREDRAPRLPGPHP
ncbi:hypothetical protein ACWGDT_37295 [Streptomyces avermitilis]